MAGDPPRHAQNPVLLTLTSKRLLGSIAALGRKWRRQRRRQISSFGSRSRSAERISTQRTSCGNRAGVAPDTAGGPKAESRKVETPWSYAFGFLIESVGDEHRLVRIKLGTRRAKETMGTVGSILTASLMLRLEKIGDLEIDVQMVDDQIRVKFRVATDAVRGMVQSRLGEMHAALKALIPEVYCQVLVDRQRSAKDPYEITSGEEKKAIDCMI